MAKDYNPKEIEPKWQKEWEKSGIYKAKDFDPKPKHYSLMEFPYPSGDGLHTGHVRGYTAMDIVSRKRRMEGFNVMFPIGWDAFGLPTENYAIKTKRPPAEITKENTKNFEKQFKELGMSFDWSREINTTDPKYYKWTQWIFLKLLEHGLAYKAKIPVNWCPKDKIVLANEEVVNGCCERCGTEVLQKEKEQWMLAITKYADKLLSGLDTVDYPERVKTQQRNWIGRSEGAEISFEVDKSESLKVFTTRPDTIFGATFLVVAGKADKFTGRYVTNPATGEKIPVWEAEYVYSDYGTGAIMGVPADDERDMEFAKKHNLPIVTDYKKAGFEDFGTRVTKYKLRDWVFSRQRYWGEPIPVVHCEKCGIVPIPESELPVKLPEVENYQPTDTGESPLANIKEFVDTECPRCGGKAKRETDVMPNWAGSSWYYLAYCISENLNDQSPMTNQIQSPNVQNKFKYWMAVDWYNGGMEHTVLHLLYSRFWNKFLYDIGVVPVDEPYKKRTSHGLIIAEDGRKMSKSLGNVINPDSIVERFGADTLRMYEMFMGPFEQAIRWNDSSLTGPRRFLEAVWRMSNKIEDKEPIGNLKHVAIKKVSEDIETLGFNTAISTLMIYSNALTVEEKIPREDYKTLLKLLAPFAPHMTEEIWRELGHSDSIHTASWPKYDETKLVSETVTIVVQVNGKVRGSFEVGKLVSEKEILEKAKSMPEIQKWIGDKTVEKSVFVPQKLVNFVIT